MAKSNLTAERLRELLNYDPDTGIFTRRIRNGPHDKYPINCPTGRAGSKGYVQIRVEKVGYKAHRLAWLYIHGKWPCQQIDHINGIRDDNRIENLRDVSQNHNQQNRKTPTKIKSRLLGAFWYESNKRWIAQIRVSGKLHYLGSFITSEEAHAAYMEAKRIYHPGYVF